MSADLARLAAGVLLVPEGAPEPVAFAAEELGAYLGRMSGREPARRSAAGPSGSWLCLAPEGTPVPERALAVPGGAEFVVQPADDAAVVSGASPRALVAGVYALLEAAGCRWSPHGSSGEHVPGPDGALHPVPTGAECVVRPADDAAVVSGASPRALLAGVYALLEAAGCRWSPHGASGEHVPGPGEALRPLRSLEDQLFVSHVVHRCRSEVGVPNLIR